MQQRVIELKKSLKEADDQCLLLFNEVQKAWKVAFSLQADHKVECTIFLFLYSQWFVSSNSLIVKVSMTMTLFSSVQSQIAGLIEKERNEREQNIQLKAQITQLSKSGQEQKSQLEQHVSKIQLLEVGYEKWEET
jgi:hypothetical protein